MASGVHSTRGGKRREGPSVYWENIIYPQPRRDTRQRIRSSIICDLNTLLRRFGVYTYYTPGRRIDPCSEEGLRICARLGMQPSLSQSPYAATVGNLA